MVVLVSGWSAVPGAWMLTGQGPQRLEDFERKAGEPRSHPRGSRRGRSLEASQGFSFPPKQRKGRRVESREPSLLLTPTPPRPRPGFVGVSPSGSGTNLLFLSHPARNMSFLSSKLSKPSLGCWRGFGVAGGPSNSPSPPAPEIPASLLLPRAGPEAS